MMNIFRWLLDVSAAAALRRGGKGGFGFGSEVDDRDYTGWFQIEGAQLLLTNLKEVELWTSLSEDRGRLARVVRSADGAILKLTVYERDHDYWRESDGPSYMGTLTEAQALAAHLLHLRACRQPCGRNF